MILPIYAYGQPVLKKVAEDITPDYPNLKELIQNMWDTMYDAHGVGLAAPQIGVSIRLFMIDSEQIEKEDDFNHVGFKRIFINAQKIEETGEKWSAEVRDKVFGVIETGHKISVEMVLRVGQRSRLLAHQPVLEESIRLRNPYIDPLHYLQVRFLTRWRQTPENRRTEKHRRLLALTVNGIAFGMKSTG